ncbi:hypothetical protein PSCICE_48550 [Pseudomonas cichorii]|nr:hypothetical protein PSCICE_48550 [Pseudomonas cichorii]GFM63248.1 hypothetical protein PSCICG_44080 [Pseudomonas cichorii]
MQSQSLNHGAHHAQVQPQHHAQFLEPGKRREGLPKSARVPEQGFVVKNMAQRWERYHRLKGHQEPTRGQLPVKMSHSLHCGSLIRKAF